MAILDTDLLSEIQSTLIETVDGGVTWASGLWTAAEVLAYLNQRQNRFLKETYLLASLAIINVSAGVARPDLPNDWIASIHATWRPPSGATYPMTRSDSWEADNGILSWETVQGQPILFMDAQTPNLKCQVAPSPLTGGFIDLIYVGLPATLTGAGELITIPDEFVPYLKWGVIADMLGKAGRGQDPKRAAYAESRWDEGIVVAKVLLSGWNV